MNSANKKMNIRRAQPQDSAAILRIMDGWGGEPLVVTGKCYYPSRMADGLLLVDQDDLIAGLLFYERQADSIEIIVIEVFEKHCGGGSRMLAELAAIAREAGVGRLHLMTTNDNVDALRFYQRRGFRIYGVRPDEIAHSRQMKPAIPLCGDYGIPIRDEIMLELWLRE